MDLKRIVKDASIHFVQFRELLIQIGQKKGEGDPWELVRMQRRTTLNNLRKACSNVIAKKPMYMVEAINKQLDLLSAWTVWLLNEINRSKIIMERMSMNGDKPQLSQRELCITEADVKEAYRLLDEIDSHKVKIKINLPVVSADGWGIEMTEFLADNSVAAHLVKKRRRPKCRPRTKYEFPQ